MYGSRRIIRNGLILRFFPCCMRRDMLSMNLASGMTWHRRWWGRELRWECMNASPVSLKISWGAAMHSGNRFMEKWRRCLEARWRRRVWRIFWRRLIEPFRGWSGRKRMSFLIRCMCWCAMKLRKCWLRRIWRWRNCRRSGMISMKNTWEYARPRIGRAYCRIFTGHRDRSAIFRPMH